MTMTKLDLGWGQGLRAMKMYHAHYNNDLYREATRLSDGTEKAVGYCNALIDEALALCGHPYYKRSDRRWCSQAIDFLQCFAREDLPKYDIYEKLLPAVFYGDVDKETLIVKDGLVLAHVFGWYNEPEHGLSQGLFKGKRVEQCVGKGWSKLRGIEKDEAQGWADEIATSTPEDL